MTTAKPKYAGADWLEKEAGKPMSELGRRVADLVGEVALGIYHWQDEVLKTDWTNTHYIVIKLKRTEFATWDSNMLTCLVVRAHDRCLRVAIRGEGMNGLALVFHARTREGSFLQRHPTMEDAIQQLRRHYDGD